MPGLHNHTGDDSKMAEGNKIVASMRQAFDGLFVANGEFTPEEASQWLEEDKAVKALQSANSSIRNKIYRIARKPFQHRPRWQPRKSRYQRYRPGGHTNQE